MPGTGVLEAWLLAAAPVALGYWWDSGARERQLASVLNRSLGKYIKDLDAEKLGADLLKGQIDIDDMELKPTALDDLGCVRTQLACGSCDRIDSARRVLVHQDVIAGRERVRGQNKNPVRREEPVLKSNQN